MKTYFHFLILALFCFSIFSSCRKVNLIEYDHEIEILSPKACDYKIGEELIIQIKFKDNTGTNTHFLNYSIDDENFYPIWTTLIDTTIIADGEYLHQDTIMIDDLQVGNTYSVSATVRGVRDAFGASDRVWFHIEP